MKPLWKQAQEDRLAAATALSHKQRLRAYQAELQVAEAMRPEDREAIAAARAERDNADAALEAAVRAKVTAEQSRPRASAELGRLSSAKDRAFRDLEEALQRLRLAESDYRINRAFRERRVKLFWRDLLADPGISEPAIRKVRVFESPAERDAAYAASKAG